MLWRNTAATRKLVQAWADLRMHPHSWDQEKKYFSDQVGLHGSKPCSVPSSVLQQS